MKKISSFYHCLGSVLKGRTRVEKHGLQVQKEASGKWEEGRKLGINKIRKVKNKRRDESGGVNQVEPRWLMSEGGKVKRRVREKGARGPGSIRPASKTSAGRRAGLGGGRFQI